MFAVFNSCDFFYSSQQKLHAVLIWHNIPWKPQTKRKKESKREKGGKNTFQHLLHIFMSFQVLNVGAEDLEVLGLKVCHFWNYCRANSKGRENLTSAEMEALVRFEEKHSKSTQVSKNFTSFILQGRKHEVEWYPTVIPHC